MQKVRTVWRRIFIASVMEKIHDILDKVEKIASKIFIIDYQTAA